MSTAVLITAETQQAIDKINEFSKRLDELGTRTRRTGEAAEHAGKGMDIFKEGLTTLAAAAGGAFTIEKVVEFAREVNRAALDMERSNTLLNNALAATQHAAGLTRAEIDDLVESLTHATNFDDDGLKKAAAALLRFRDVQGDTFQRGLALSADFAAAMGTDVVTAAQAVGRALESPGNGMRALRAAGVALSDQQADLVDKLAKTGKYADAQKIVLDALQASVGGAARGEHKGLSGATADAGKAWDDLLKTIGNTGLYKDTVTGFQEHASSRFRLLAEDIKALGSWWDRYLEAVARHKSMSAIEAESKAAEVGRRAQQRAVEDDEKRKAEQGAERQRQLQVEQAAYEKRKDAEEEARKAAEKSQAAYDALMKTIREKIAVDEAEIANGGPLTEAQKLRAENEAKLTQAIGRGASARRDAAQTEIDRLDLLERARAADQLYQKYVESGRKAEDERTKALNEAIDKAREEVETFGLSRAAIEGNTIARMEERLELEKAHATSTPAQLAALEAEIAKRKELQSLIAQKEILDANKRAVDEADKEWKRFTDDIERSLTDALMRGFDKGKSFGQNFFESLKHSLESAVLKIGVQAIVTPVMGAVRGLVGGGGAASVTGAGGLLDLASGANSLYGLYNGTAGAAGLYGAFAGSSIGQALGLSSVSSFVGPSASYAAGGTGVATELGLTSLGSTIGAALPWVGGALAIGSALGLFGGGGEDPHNNADKGGVGFTLTSRGVSGMSGRGWDDTTTGFNGVGPFTWSQGQTSGSGRWEDKYAMSATQIADIAAQAAVVYASGRQMADLLGVDPSAVDSTTVGGKFASAAEALSQLSDAVALNLVPNLKDFQNAGQTLFQTLQTDVAAVQALRSQFDAFKNQIALGDLSDLDPLSKYRLAKDLYNQALAGGDAGAVTSAAQQFLGASKTAFSSASAAYATDYSQVMASLTAFESAATRFPWASSAASSAAPSVTGQQVADNTQATVTVLQAGLTQLIALAQAQGESQAEINRKLGQVLAA